MSDVNRRTAIRSVDRLLIRRAITPGVGCQRARNSMNKATMRAARRNYAILHNGPSGPARQVECKTAFRIIARNENEYARARARGSLEYFEPFGHTRYVTSRKVLFEYRKCFFTLVSPHVPNGTGTKPKAWKKKKKTTVKAITQSQAVSRISPVRVRSIFI